MEKPSKAGEIRRRTRVGNNAASRFFLDTPARKTCQPFLRPPFVCKSKFIVGFRGSLCVIFPRPLRVCWYGVPSFSSRILRSRERFAATFPSDRSQSQLTSEVPRTGRGFTVKPLPSFLAALKPLFRAASGVPPALPGKPWHCFCPPRPSRCPPRTAWPAPATSASP